MKNIATALTLLVANIAHADPRVNYVGDGRYTCSGTQQECTPTQQRNEAREQQREAEKRGREQVEEERRQTRILEEIRDEVRRRER